MLNIKFVAAALAATMTLTACGGGGGSTGPQPVDPRPNDPAPTGTTTAELEAFVAGGTSTNLSDGVTRRSRNFVQDGVSGTVAVDRLQGSDVGLVQYRLGNDVFIYRLTGEPVANVVLPTGNYNGPLSISYRMDANSGWSVMSGDANLYLNFESGQVDIGGMASNDQHSIELFGGAQVSGGQFVDTNTTVRLRDAAAGGSFIRDEVGTVTGALTSTEHGDAIFGLVESINTQNGFEAHGGFTTVLWQGN